MKQLGSTDYKLVLSILETWKEIKRVREEQSYASTNVQLTVHRYIDIYLPNNLIIL